MTTLQKKLLIVIGILTVCMVCVTGSLFMALYINPNQLHVKTQTIKSSYISSELNLTSMVYFTDLQYGTFEDDDRVEKLISTIEELDPSIVIFGGDLYDDAYTADDASNQKLIDFLNRIEAPMGKFCVLGEKDTTDEAKSQAVQTVYDNSGFEILNNTSVRITNGGSTGIRLNGLSTTPDYSILQSDSPNEYNIVVTHYPDVLQDASLASASISLALAGNAHGTQISYPIVGGYKSVEGSQTINRTSMPSLSFDVVLSAGVGCTDVNARYNADPEIHYFLFSHTDA